MAPASYAGFYWWLGFHPLELVDRRLRSGVKARRYYHQDIFQSVDAVSNSAGQIISRKRFSPYGIEESTDGSSHSDYGFLGKRVERDAGISLLGARAYLPDIGRFLGPDAINVDVGGVGFFNRYAYGINNPLKYVDPTGFYAEKTMPDDRDDKGLGGDNDGDEKARNTESVFGSDEDDLEGAVQLAAGPLTPVAVAAMVAGAKKYGGSVAKPVIDFFKRLTDDVSKGLTTPKKYFGSKTKQEVKDALEKKYGPPKSSREHADTYYNDKTKRSYNVHEEPGHNEGKPHVDIRRRGGYEERKYDLKEVE